MILVSSNALLVLDPSSGSLVSLDWEGLRREVTAAFQRCAMQEDWVGDSLLQVLQERLQLGRSEGMEFTEQDVRRMLVGVLDASGFTDVAREFIVHAPKAQVVEQVEFPGQLRSWNQESLEDFLKHQPEIPESAVPAILEALPQMLSGAGYPLVSEALVREFSRHLVHLQNLPPDGGALSVQSRVQYISSREWQLPLSEESQRLLDRRVLLLQPVSDILPVSIVQCRLARLFDFDDAPSGEAGLLSRLPSVASAVQECLVLMRGKMTQRWPELGDMSAVVRFVEFEALLQLLDVSRRRRERRELGARLQKAILGHFVSSPFPIVVRFS